MIELTRRVAMVGARFLGLPSTQGIAQPIDFKLTVARKHKDHNCTSGYLAVNGKVIAYTLELPWKGNAPLISSIPDGYIVQSSAMTIPISGA
jgi:hypothetical protein